MAKSANSVTALSKQDPLGIIVKAPPPKKYLCEHICRCKSSALLLDALGSLLRQRCVTKGVANDFDNHVQNVYFGELGYDMTKMPPALLMSKDNLTRPSSFPLGAATRGGLLNVTKQQLEEAGGSAFHIPDVIKINTPGQSPMQSNIDLVIEIKFVGDSWGRGQKESNERIAGGIEKLMLITEKECRCKE